MKGFVKEANIYVEKRLDKVKDICCNTSMKVRGKEVQEWKEVSFSWITWELYTECL